MANLFIGKRFYTNRDAYLENFGRIYKLPYYWSIYNPDTQLWLIDYHGKRTLKKRDGSLTVISTPVLSFSFILMLLKTLFRRHKLNNIIASGDCYIGLLGSFLAKLKRCQFTFDVYDKYDEFEGYRNFFSFNILNYLLKSSDHIFCASRNLANTYSAINNKLSIVENGYEPVIFKSIEKSDCRKSLNLDTKKTYIGYIGSMEPDRGIEDLINAVNYLTKNGKKITVLLAGKLNDQTILNNECVEYLGNVNSEVVPLVMNSCDYLALPYRRSKFLDMASSCKIAEYFAVGKPIIATETPNLVYNFPLQSAQLKGRLAEPGSPLSIAKVIQLQIEHPQLVSPAEELNWQKIADNAYQYLSK